MATAQALSGETDANKQRGIGPIGTVARIATGLGLFGLATWAGVRGELQWYEVFVGLVVLPAIVMAGVLVSKRILGTSSYLRATGPVSTFINLAIIVALFANPFTTNIAYIFYGVPMFLAAWRGYPGCEMFAISNFVLRRGDELGCPWFWPIDTFEIRLTQRQLYQC